MESIRLLPDSILVTNFEDSNKVRIFFSTEITCFSCKQKGHMANSCPNNQTENLINVENSFDPTVPQSNSNTIPAPAHPSTSQQPIQSVEQKNSTEKILQPDTETEKNRPKPVFQFKNPQLVKDSSPTPKCKRPAPNPSSTSSVEDEMPNNNDEDELCNLTPDDSQRTDTLNVKKVNAKKKRAISPPNPSTLTREHLQILKDQMDSPGYVLNFENFITFIDEIQTSNNYIETVKKFTDNIPGLLYTLQDIKNHLSSTAKNKLTRLTNRIKEHMNQTLDTLDSPLPNTQPST